MRVSGGPDATKAAAVDMSMRPKEKRNMPFVTKILSDCSRSCIRLMLLSLQARKAVFLLTKKA